MAIGTDAAIDFFGTKDEVISIAGAAVATGSYSDSGDLTSWTNDDDAREAELTCNFTFGGNPTAGTTVDVYVRLMDIDGTTDAEEPGANVPYRYMNSFPLNAGGTTTVCTITIALPNQYTSQVYNFYLKNNSGQNLNTGSTVDITPKAVGPHA